MAGTDPDHEAEVRARLDEQERKARELENRVRRLEIEVGIFRPRTEERPARC